MLLSHCEAEISLGSGTVHYYNESSGLSCERNELRTLLVLDMPNLPPNQLIRATITTTNCIAATTSYLQFSKSQCTRLLASQLLHRENGGSLS